jgi:hypothetical protein
MDVMRSAAVLRDDHLGLEATMDNATPELVSFPFDVHRRKLENMLARIELAVEVGSWSEARRRFAVFRCQMDGHIRLEEELLFPSFEVVLGGRRCTTRLRAAHRDLCRLLDHVEASLGDERPVGDLITQLASLFAGHAIEEDRLVYPAFDRTASPRTQAAALAELDSLVRGIG